MHYLTTIWAAMTAYRAAGNQPRAPVRARRGPLAPGGRADTDGPVRGEDGAAPSAPAAMTNSC